MKRPGTRTLAPLPTLMAALALLAGTAAAETPAMLEGPARVVDGRTLDVAGRTVRLAGIDGPDPAQTCRWNGRTIPCGTIAGDALKDLITGAAVRCRIEGTDGPHLIGTCTADGFDIGGNMVHTGWAVAGPGAPARYKNTEAKSRAAGRGLWRGEFVHPASWRAGRRLD